MCSGREVRVSLVLPSVITVLCCGIGAFGGENARSTSTDAGRVTRSTSRLLLHPCDCSAGRVVLLGEGRASSSHLERSCSTLPAMAIPDGPGAVCLSILGFVCVSAMRNRRAWMSLCLCVLGCGRVSSSRLVRDGVAGADDANPDWPGDCGPEQSLFQARRPALYAGGDLMVPVLGFCLLRTHLVGVCGDPGPKGLPPRIDLSFGNLRKAAPLWFIATTPVGPLSVGRVELARPPPVGA